jgi:hypothetical protein
VGLFLHLVYLIPEDGTIPPVVLLILLVPSVVVAQLVSERLIKKRTDFRRVKDPAKGPQTEEEHRAVTPGTVEYLRLREEFQREGKGDTHNPVLLEMRKTLYLGALVLGVLTVSLIRKVFQ